MTRHRPVVQYVLRRVSERNFLTRLPLRQSASESHATHQSDRLFCRGSAKSNCYGRTS